MTISRSYKQGAVTLAFPNGGPSVRFRINPDAVDWNFKVKTAVIDTIGGRVIQVLGADLSDMTVRGRFGSPAGQEGSFWKEAESFLAQMRVMANYQARDANVQGQDMHPPAIFTFPAKNWSFDVYLKSITDGQGQLAINHSAGKYSYDYVLTFSVFNDRKNTSRVIGQNNGVLRTSKDKAVEEYLNRIYDGIGWHLTSYNGPMRTADTIARNAPGAGRKKTTP